MTVTAFVSHLATSQPGHDLIETLPRPYGASMTPPRAIRLDRSEVRQDSRGAITNRVGSRFRPARRGQSHSCFQLEDC